MDVLGETNGRLQIWDTQTGLVEASGLDAADDADEPPATILAPATDALQAHADCVNGVRSDTVSSTLICPSCLYGTRMNRAPVCCASLFLQRIIFFAY